MHGLTASAVAALTLLHGESLPWPVSQSPLCCKQIKACDWWHSCQTCHEAF